MFLAKKVFFCLFSNMRTVPLRLLSLLSLNSHTPFKGKKEQWRPSHNNATPCENLFKSFVIHRDGFISYSIVNYHPPSPSLSISIILPACPSSSIINYTWDPLQSLNPRKIGQEPRSSYFNDSEFSYARALITPNNC